MSRTLASSKFIYTEDTYREYYKLRENQNKTYRRLYIAGLILFGIGAAGCLYAFFTDGGPVMLVCALVCIAFVVVVVDVLRKPAANADRNAMRDFFKRHGTNVDAPGQWAFRECVEVTDEGIAIAFGPLGCPDSDLLPVFKPWSQWETVASSDKIITVLCVNDVKLGVGFYLLGALYSSVRLQEAIRERDQYEDAVLPLDRLGNQNADEVVQIIKQHIGQTTGNIDTRRKAVMEQSDWSSYNGEQGSTYSAPYSTPTGRNFTFSPNEDARKKVNQPYLIAAIVSVCVSFFLVVIVYTYVDTLIYVTSGAELPDTGLNVVTTMIDLAFIILYLVRSSQSKNQLVTLRERQIDVETYYGIGADRTNYIIHSVSSVEVSSRKIKIRGDIEQITKNKPLDTLALLRVYSQADEQLLMRALENMGHGLSPFGGTTPRS